LEKNMMPSADIIRLRERLPQTTAQAGRLKKLARSDEPIDIAITVLSQESGWLEQRTWRFLFGLYQDSACIQWSRGFKKTLGIAFKGKIRPSRLTLFLREAMVYVRDDRATVSIEGEPLRKRLLEVM
jgi:hypothetical protein